jgi:hypothetical protein
MRFKYHTYVNNLTDCPPSHAYAQDLTAFRFVFNQIEDHRNFAPAYILKPKRRLARDPHHKTCRGYGLSLFDTVENACKFYADFVESSPNFPQTVGTHVAQGQINESDGIVTEPDVKGHFTLYEFEHTNLYVKFQIVHQVYYDEIA